MFVFSVVIVEKVPCLHINYYIYQIYTTSNSIEILVLILDGNSEIGAHGWSDLGYI